MAGTTIKTLLLSISVCFAATVESATFTVSKDGSGKFTTIQAAIDAAAIGDEIIILDNAVYDEQVTIDSLHQGLILRSEDPSSPDKPAIRFKDAENVHPMTYAESQDKATINYSRNGALRIVASASVRIEGLIIDGGGAMPFAYPAIWEGVTPLFHGNAAVAIDVSAEAIIRDCEMRNAYFGIYCHDRNEGGVFASPNPADINPEYIIPFSAYARSGNHLIEYNRIHDNSWGLYFESLWDMGSTVRYNLIYNNHHGSETLAAQVAAMPGGIDQAGGAMLFKDDLCTPVAIFNNTFYRNFLNFAGLTRTGAQHLIFNNIYSSPFRLWSDDPNFPNPPAAMDQRFVNRMYHSVYGCQAEPPEMTSIRLRDSVYDAEAGRYIGFDTTVTAISRIRIMSGMEQVKKGMEVAITVHLSSKDTVITRTLPEVIQPGNPITAMTNLKPFPETSNVRWAEIPFLSTDPSNAKFLEPDWNSELVRRYVVDQGWPASGIKDADFSAADLGAIPMAGSRPADVVTVRPTVPVEIDGVTAKIGFNVTPRIGTMTDLKIIMLRCVKDIDSTGQEPFIPAENIVSIPIPEQRIILGSNTIGISSPELSRRSLLFFELIVEGTGGDGRPFTTSVGFMAHRSIYYELEAEVLDPATVQPVTEVRAGAPCVLRVSAFYNDEPFTNKIDPTDVKLQSRFPLLSPEGNPVTSFPEGITGSTDIPIIFTRLPLGGVEYVLVAGRWIDAGKVIAFLASSQGVRVLAGKADSISFQRPASGMREIINHRETFAVKVQAYDMYGNRVDSGSAIKCVSTEPEIGIIPDSIVNTDSTGMATFRAIVTNGDSSMVFPLVASLVNNPTQTDTAYLVIGTPAAILPPSARIINPPELLCELIDLRGRVVKRMMVYRRLPAGGKSPFNGIAGRGLYLVRMTDIATGKVTTGRRLLIHD
ncbi:MAG: right-handed parallel beta-helix repeat-containing protein [Chitinispirillaceae bacterium]|nr:right-handed parallel beta-helix repeat-containing protein [Chitinispirillaceae bacterium]